jgi:hypothetical protein
MLVGGDFLVAANIIDSMVSEIQHNLTLKHYVTLVKSEVIENYS